MLSLVLNLILFIANVGFWHNFITFVTKKLWPADHCVYKRLNFFHFLFLKQLCILRWHQLENCRYFLKTVFLSLHFSAEPVTLKPFAGRWIFSEWEWNLSCMVLHFLILARTCPFVTSLWTGKEVKHNYLEIDGLVFLVWKKLIGS